MSKTGRSVSERVTIADVKLKVIRPDGSTMTFFGQDVTKAWNIAHNEPRALGDGHHFNVTLNGETSYSASTELSSGDTIIVRESSEGWTGNNLNDDTDYTLQLVFTGGEDPKVIAEGEARLR